MTWISSSWRNALGGAVNDLDIDDLAVDELPKPYETEPDENGVKQVVRFEEKQDGTRVKITRTVQVQKRTTYVKKAVLERRVREGIRDEWRW